MRYLIAVTTAAMIATPAMADTMAHCGAAWKAMTPTEASAAGSYQAWSKKCLAKDYAVPAVPASKHTPDGSTAQCKDGTYSSSKTARGRCSGHGGVTKVL